MARKKAAGAVKTTRKAANKNDVVSEKEARQSKAQREDEQAKEDAQKQTASGPTAQEADDQKKEVDEQLAAEFIAESEAAVRLREKFNAGLRQNVVGQHTITMNIEEEAEVQKFLAELRVKNQAKRSSGGVSQKRYLVNDNPGPVRMGGVTYNVPAGRHEITPEFLKQYFPSTVTADGLQGGMLAGRFRVESDPEPESKKADGKKGDDKASKSSGSGKAQPGHGRQPANDLSTSTHPEAQSLAQADRANYIAGRGVR